jgi:ribosomal protein S7
MTHKSSFINQLMSCGNKWKSENIFLKTSKKIQKLQKLQSNTIFKFAVINSSPYFDIKQVKKRKKKLIEFPFLLPNTLRISCSIKNIINQQKKILHLNLIDSVDNSGVSVDLKKKIHKESFLKKKVSNYRWF